MNSTNLIGRFAKDPDLKYTPSGKAVTNFTLAVRNPFDPDNADFIQCVAWEKAAELIAESCKKGHMLGVEGRLSVRWYENDQQQRIYVTEVNVNMITFIQGKEQQNEEPEKPENRPNSRSNNNNRSNNSSRSGNGNSNNRQRP